MHGVRCARVKWEINSLLPFETAPFFVYTLYYSGVIPSAVASITGHAISPVMYPAQGYKHFAASQYQDEYVTPAAHVIPISDVSVQRKFMVYVSTPSIVLNYKRQWIGRDMEGRGRGLISCTIIRDWRKPRTVSVMIGASCVEIWHRHLAYT